MHTDLYSFSSGDLSIVTLPGLMKKTDPWILQLLLELVVLHLLLLVHRWLVVAGTLLQESAALLAAS